MAGEGAVALESGVSAVRFDLARGGRLGPRRLCVLRLHRRGADAAEASGHRNVLAYALANGLLAQEEVPEVSQRLAENYRLVRWNDPVRGMLGPDLFIPMAEETGHIRALTEWVLQQAVADHEAASSEARSERVETAREGAQRDGCDRPEREHQGEHQGWAP